MPEPTADKLEAMIAEAAPLAQASGAAAEAEASVQAASAADEAGPRYEALPSYTKSLLRIAVPVTVKLASKKQPIARIVELRPGSIIQFDKSCEDMLELEASGRTIAEGEAVKVGDKFGLRITTLKVPGERFQSVRKRPAPCPEP